MFARASRLIVVVEICDICSIITAKVCAETISLFV